MRFALSEEQMELAEAVASLVTRRAGSMDVRAALDSEAGYDDTLWRTLSEQIGVTALAIPEEFGGAGFSSFETHVVLEQLGRSLTGTPLLGSALLPAQALLLADDHEACARILPGIAEGRTPAAVAWADRHGRWRTDGSDVTASGPQWTLDGKATLVLDGLAAEVLLVVATTGSGPALFEVAADATGVTRAARPAVDSTLAFADITFAATPATPVDGGDADLLVRLRAVAATAVTALQVGGAQGALERTVAYLTEREQFGRPLGSFQALKHRVADLLVAVETSRSVSWAAAWAVAQDTPDLVREAAIAKAWCSDSFSTVAGEMVQLHGGIAITWEHDAQLFFKRAHATAQLFGQAHEHRRTLLAA